MQFSAEQQSIFDWFKSGAGNLVIEARAGTGKTTTIKQAFSYAPENRMLYCVFNKKNEIEAKGKITDPRVQIKTLHALGYQYIRKVWSKARPDDAVEFDRISQFRDFTKDTESAGNIVKLIGYAKNTCIHPTADDLAKIIESQDIEFAEGIDGIGIALEAIELAKTPDRQGRISFNDMVWLPVAMNWVKPWFELVVVDESQDMNAPQLVMARNACEKTGRVVVLGDSRQCIYAFRGASHNGMATMKVTLNAKVLSLTTTYRCASKVVKLATEIVPDYKAAETAPEGIIGNVSDTMEAKPGDAILSRLNAPLMPLALSMLRKGISVRIEGRDIGKQLYGMVKSFKAKSVPHFLERLEAWRTKQEVRLGKSKFSAQRIEQTNDIAATLQAVAEGATSVADIESKIFNLFQDTDSNSRPAVVLSSVHKAKGLEWERVFMLSETFRKGKGIEEDNIWYVAVTRAKRELYFVSPKKEKQIADKIPATLPEKASFPCGIFPATQPVNGSVSFQTA